MQFIYSLISKTFKYKFVRDIKERLRPLKQKLVGRNGIYYAIDVVNRLKKGDVKTVFDLGEPHLPQNLIFSSSLLPQLEQYIVIVILY